MPGEDGSWGSLTGSDRCLGVKGSGLTSTGASGGLQVVFDGDGKIRGVLSLRQLRPIICDLLM